MSAETQRILAELDLVDVAKPLLSHPAHAAVTEVLRVRLKITEQEAAPHATMVLAVLMYQGLLAPAPQRGKPPHG